MDISPYTDKIAGSGIRKINRSTGRYRFLFFFSHSVAAHPTSFVSSMCVACWKSWVESQQWGDISHLPTSSTAVCNVCKVNVSRGGGSTAKYNATNLIKHIQNHHAKEHAEFLQLNKTRGAGDRTAQQLTLADALQWREKFPTESLEALAIAQKVSEFIVLDAWCLHANVSCWKSPPSPTGIHRAKVLSSITSSSIFQRPVYSLLFNNAIGSVSGIDRYTKPRHRYCYQDWKSWISASLFT